MRHRTTEAFWQLYNDLPPPVRSVAHKNFLMLKDSPAHPSLQFKRIGKVWSVRAGIDFRALALQKPDGFYWFWIGPHDEYDRLIS